MMLKKYLMVSLICVSIVLAGCGSIPTTTTAVAIPTQILTAVPQVETTTIPQLETAVPPEVAQAIKNKVSQLIGVAVDTLQVKSIEPKDWPDSCLGLPEANETCTTATTPGWLIAFTVNGQDFRFRVDQTGTNIRREP
jgi:hypothetical protein